jgi:DNA transposition AAA+ family ATPase
MTVPAADQQSRIKAHLDALWKRLERLRKVEAKPGRGGAAKAKEASDRADKIERRISRLSRAKAHLDAQADKDAARARRKARSKNPRERAEVVLGALDELPVDLALEVCEEAMRRAQARAGAAG